MIDTKLSNIINAAVTMQKIVVSNPSLKGSHFFIFQDIIEELNKHLKKFDESRIFLLKRYGVAKDDGTYEITEQENADKFNEEYMELINTDIKLNSELLPKDIFNDCSLTYSEGISISFLVKK